MMTHADYFVGEPLFCASHNVQCSSLWRAPYRRLHCLQSCCCLWTYKCQGKGAWCPTEVAAVRAGTFHSNLPKIVQTLRYALLHKDKRTFADASEAKADWWVT